MPIVVDSAILPKCRRFLGPGNPAAIFGPNSNFQLLDTPWELLSICKHWDVMSVYIDSR